MRKLIILITALLIPFSVFSVYTDVGSSAYTYLNIDASVKAGGMGGAFSSLMGNAEGLSYNLASVGNMEKSSISFTYMNWVLEGSSLNNLQLALPLFGKFVLGFQWKVLNYPSIDKYDEYGFYLRQQFVPNDNMMTFSLSTQLSDALYLGVGAGAVKENIDSYAATAWFVNIGLIYKMDKLSAGIAANYLPVIEKEMVEEAMPLPMTFRIGVSYQAMDELLIAVDVEKPNYNSMMIHAGAEYKLMDIIAIRAGYKTGSVEGLTFGFGAEKELLENFNVSVDYAFGLASYDFNALHRVGVTFTF